MSHVVKEASQKFRVQDRREDGKGGAHGIVVDSWMLDNLSEGRLGTRNRASQT
jgi:hypothetical protein